MEDDTIMRTENTEDMGPKIIGAYLDLAEELEL